MASWAPRSTGQLDLAGYYLFHAIRGHLLRQLGRTAEAAAAYQEALARAGNAAERDFLRRRLRSSAPGADLAPPAPLLWSTAAG